MRALYIAAVTSVIGVDAHIRMQFPEPFGNLLSNQRPNLPHPLGLNMDNAREPVLFPCQTGPHGIYDFTRATTIAAGNSILVSFIGEINALGEHTTAGVHGGGSCQISLAKTPSENPRDWKVIKTFIGGCPATAQGNLQPAPWRACSNPDSTETECLKSYNIDIPSEVPTGQYFFAWTWFNKIGNREMYMQCAPVIVINGGNDELYLDSLPSIFIANENGESSTCITEYGGVLGIVNPGLNVEISSHESDAVVDAVLAPCSAIYGDPLNAPNYPVRGSTGGALTPPRNTSTAVFVPPLTVPATKVSSQVVTIPTVGIGTPVPNNPSTCANGDFQCPVDGIIVCLSSTQWGLCSHGCVKPQDVAAGTVCENGLIIARLREPLSKNDNICP